MGPDRLKLLAEMPADAGLGITFSLGIGGPDPAIHDGSRRGQDIRKPLPHTPHLIMDAPPKGTCAEQLPDAPVRRWVGPAHDAEFLGTVTPHLPGHAGNDRVAGSIHTALTPLPSRIH